MRAINMLGKAEEKVHVHVLWIGNLMNTFTCVTIQYIFIVVPRFDKEEKNCRKR